MNYFEIVSYVFGAIMILTRVAIHLFPEKWNNFELKTAYTENQPRWVWMVGFIGLLLVAFTWYMHFTAGVPYSLVLTILLSLTLVKTYQVLFNYQQFRAFAVRVLERDRKTLALLNIAVLFMGTGTIMMGIFLY
ncbi:MAG: hypothetical protein R6U91_10150 [Bacillota bacterium]